MKTINSTEFILLRVVATIVAIGFWAIGGLITLIGQVREGNYDFTFGLALFRILSTPLAYEIVLLIVAILWAKILPEDE